MEPENNLSPNALLEIENRQYNETNLLYHTTAALFGLSDTVFWVLYSAVRQRHAPDPGPDERWLVSA